MYIYCHISLNGSKNEKISGKAVEKIKNANFH